MIYLLIILAVIVIYALTFYNRLKTLQVQIRASIQEIGNQLKRQADLIPNLVESAKGYLKHEKDIFKMLTAARTSVLSAVESGSSAKIDEAQNLINKALQSFRAVLESNPQLQAATVVTDLMNELRDTADKLMYSRRTMIDLTADYNTAIATIPGVWLASLFGFQPEKGLDTPTTGPHLEVSESETVSPKVKLD
ncbi:LemA family protein [Patescibacteria group bacterium]|nr:LemA family protein [Patescibacteria group bacterium]